MNGYITEQSRSSVLTFSQLVISTFLSRGESLTVASPRVPRSCYHVSIFRHISKDLAKASRGKLKGSLQHGTWGPIREAVSNHSRDNHLHQAAEAALQSRRISKTHTSAPTRASFVEIMVEALYAMWTKLRHIQGEPNPTAKASFKIEAAEDRVEWE